MSVNTPEAPAGVAHAAGAGAGAGGLGVACLRTDGQEPGSPPALAPSAGDAVLWQGWPLGDFQEFTPQIAAVPPARRRARFIVGVWGLGYLSGDVEYVLGELAANAVAACAPGPGPVRAWVLSDRHGVLVQVWDPCPRPPHPADASADAEGGRGLALVAGLSTRWGWYPEPEAGGKVTWALITR